MDFAKVHEEKYRAAKAAGLPGWGGAKRIAELPGVIEKRFLSFAGLPRSGRLLELGCGAGNVAIELARRGYDVVGVDFSATAVSWAKENAQKMNVAADFLLASVTDLSCFQSESFDLVYDGNCIHCLIGDDRRKAFREIRRVMKPVAVFFVSSLCAEGNEFPAEFDGETYVLSESGLPYRYIPSPEILEKELEAAGFEILKKEVRADRPFGHVNFHARTASGP